MKLRTWCIRSGQKLAKPVLVFAGFLVFLTIFNPATIQAEDDRGGITLRHENVPIQKVFQTIEKQSGYRFFYNETLLQGAVKVTLHLQNVSLQEALDACFRNQPLSYAIVDKTIIVKRKPEQQSVAPIQAAVSYVKADKGKLIAVRGKVTSNNVPVVGASIMIKGTDNGASTDKEGIFTLAEVDEEATLIVSSVSHEAREVKVNGQGFISIDLDQKVNELDDAVVIAYNTTTRRMNTGSVTVVKGEDIQRNPSRSFDKSLQGLVPGLLVTGGSGQPGGSPVNFVLRGIATGGEPTNGETFRNPLIVIDGIPVSQEPATSGLLQGSVSRITNPLAQINPSDIESITVLKDAAAVALYGSKASNGVLLVTTKRGKAGKTIFNFRHQTDISSALDGKIKMLNQDEYLELLYEAYRNSNPTMTDAAILADLKTKFPTQPDGSFYPQSDWKKAMFNNTAATISNEISMSGGNDKSNFYLNFEYTKQNGAAKKNSYDRKSFRFNYEHRPTSWLKVGTNTTLSYNIQKYGNALSYQSAESISPMDAIRDTNGNYIYKYAYGHYANQGTFFPNPAAERDLNINTSTVYRGLTKLYGEVKLFNDFTFASTLGIDFMLNEAKEKIHPLVSESNGSLLEQTFRTAGIITNNILRYNKTLNKIHSLNVLAGQEAQLSTDKYLSIKRDDLSTNPDQDQLFSGNVSSAVGNTAKQTLLSYFGQLNYGLMDRYFLTGSLRSDGSSRFGKNNRFGTYWSVGGGWVVSSEPFMKATNGWLNYFKLRGSIGQAGNAAAVADLIRFDPLMIRNFLNGVAVYPGANNPGNPNIQWEQTYTWDAGLELRMAKDRIAITADLYNRKTKNLIAYNINLPLATGSPTFTSNVGDVKNHGIELSVSAKIIRLQNFQWNMSGNWSRNQNTLVKSFFPRLTVVGTSNALVNEVGYEYNSFFLKPWAGVNPDNGRPTWIDSTTGKPIENWDAAKASIVGKAQPDGFGSIMQTFSYRRIDLSMTIYYQYGSKIYYNSNLQNDGIGNPYVNQTRDALNRWQKPGDVAANPRRLLNGTVVTPTGSVKDQGNLTSTRFLYDGDFIRLSNVSVGYNFPKKMMDHLRLHSIRVFVQGSNLATWTKYWGQDPENIGASGFGNILYPQQRSFSFGLNVSL